MSHQIIINRIANLSTDTVSGNMIQNGDFVLDDASQNMFDLTLTGSKTSPRTGKISRESRLNDITTDWISLV